MGWGLGGGGLGGLVNSITGASQSARQQNQYAVAMSKMNFKQQKDMYEWQAKEGPKMQMEGYANAGVNPIYGLGGLNPSSGAGGTGGAPGGGAGGGVALMSALAGMYNDTRATDAKIGLDSANANLAKAEAEAALINANANMTSAMTNKNLANKGLGGKVFGLEGGTAQSIAASLLPLAIGGAGGAAIKGYKAYKGWKAAKGFGSFLKSLK